jgi:Spy/CpxP family protein refolding chaperone
MDQTRTHKLLLEIGLAALLAITVIGIAVGSIASTRPWGHDPERMRKHADFAVEYALREVDATPEQVARVKAIVGQALTALDGVHDQHAANRDALIAALSQPEISRAQIQEIRAQELALADSASVTIVDALVDAAAVLTPEQRAQLIELARELHGHEH